MISVWDSCGHKEVTEYMNMIKKNHFLSKSSYKINEC